MNKWLVTGKLTKDPETKEGSTRNGGDWVNTTICVEVPRGYKDKKTGLYLSDVFEFKVYCLYNEHLTI